MSEAWRAGGRGEEKAPRCEVRGPAHRGSGQHCRSSALHAPPLVYCSSISKSSHINKSSLVNTDSASPRELCMGLAISIFHSQHHKPCCFRWFSFLAGYLNLFTGLPAPGHQATTRKGGPVIEVHSRPSQPQKHRPSFTNHASLSGQVPCLSLKPQFSE